jgi:thiosulfate dehydrogenase [quinone] large subunit
MRFKTLFEWRELPDPAWVRAAFSNVWAAPFWLVLRVYLGYQWLHAGWGKVNGDGWVNGDGAALRGFWTRIVAVPAQGTPPIHYGWYRDFIQFMLDQAWYSWFAQVIAYGELAIGIALILGAFTGFAAITGAFVNFNFMLAGTASTNPVLFLLAILLLLAWKVAGYIGMDRWLLPMFGTPWSRGHRHDGIQVSAAPPLSG